MANKKNDKEEKPFKYEFSRPYCACDLLILGYSVEDRDVKILLTYRPNEGRWAFPGSLIHCSDDPEDEWGAGAETERDCIHRMLTDMKLEILFPEAEQNPMEKRTLNIADTIIPLTPKTAVERDSGRKDENGKEVRLRVISLPYIAFVKPAELWGDKYKNYRWVSLPKVLYDNDLTVVEPKFPTNRMQKKIESYPDVLSFKDPTVYKLAFDHGEQMVDLVATLRRRLRAAPFGREILDNRFKMIDLQTIYQSILGRKIDTSNFRKSFCDRFKERETTKGKERKTFQDSQEDSNVLRLISDNTASHSVGRPPLRCEFVDKVYDYYTATNSFAFVG